MTNCSRCGNEIKSGERFVEDPCCSSPDCEEGHLAWQSHYKCLPTGLQEIEDRYEEEYYNDYNDYYEDYPRT